jgi:ketosteroid isomerase-like protein
MSPAEFMEWYAQCTNTHHFAEIAPLLADDAVYWFNDGSFVGIAEIKAAFEKTWEIIQDEHYAIENIQWLIIENTSAVCIYHFHWSGKINGNELQEGSGRGTSVLGKNADGWQVIHEHLSGMPLVDKIDSSN